MRNILTLALLFVLGSPIAWSQSVVNFPIPTDSGPAGYAILNPGTAAASVTFTAFSAALDGAQLASVAVTVPGGGQMAKLGTELFPGATNPQGGLRGWVQATSATSGLLGMESTGDFSTGVDAINGAMPSLDQILPVSGTTRIFAGNPGVSVLTVTIKAYDSNGNQVGSTITKTLQAKGLYDSQAQDGILFGTSQFPLLAAAEHVRISATASVVASAILSTTILPSGGDSAAVNGTDVAGAQTILNFPHVVNGPLGGLNYVSLVGVTNPTASQQTLTLTFNPDSGSQQSMQTTVKPNGSLQGTIHDLFGLPSGYQSGWLQVGGAAQLVGYVAFGETTGGGIDLVPVQPAAQTTLLFGQLAELAPWYTGLALLNPSTTDATVEVYAMSTDGSLIGDPQDFSVGHFTLPAKTRTARLISQFIPATDTRSTDGGFVFVRTTNNVPLFGMALFSLRSGAAMANVAAEGLPQGITYSPLTRQPSARDFTPVTLPPLDPSFLPSIVSPNRPTPVIPNLELQYDSTVQFVYPFDPLVTRWIDVKNNGGYTEVEFDGVITGPGGFSIQIGGLAVAPFPQPPYLYLQPGESQRIWVVLNWQDLDQTPWAPGNTYDYRMDMRVYPKPNGQTPAEMQAQTQTVTLYDTINVILTDVPPPSNLPVSYNNATISGTVHDAATGEPIVNVQVRLVAGHVPSTFKPWTDSSGAFSIPVTAYEEAQKDIWTEYGVTIQASGYADFHTAVAPHAGDDIKIDAQMIPAVGTVSYSITSKFDGVLNQYGAEGSKDGKYVAFTPFHSIVPAGVDSETYLAQAQLYFFSTDGTRLWQFPLYGEVPDVAVSDDGSLVATARPDRTRSDNGVYLLNTAGNIVWFVGNLGSTFQFYEFRFSHDNKYLATGDTGGNLYLLDIASKTVVWRRFVLGQIRTLQFESDDATLYVGSGDGYLYTLKIDGTVAWRTYVGSWPISFSYSTNYILVCGKEGYYLSLLDKATGRILWKYPFGTGPNFSIIAPDESYMYISGSANQNMTLMLDRNGVVLYYDDGGGSGFVTDDSAYILLTGDESAPNDYGSIWIKVIDRAGHELWKISNVDTTIDRGPMEGYSWMSKDGKKMIVATGNWIYFLSGSLPSSK